MLMPVVRKLERRDTAAADRYAAERRRLNRAFGIVVRGTRQAENISQEQFAVALGWTRSMVANMECGRRQLHAMDIFLIAQALRVTPQVLIERMAPWAGKTL